ncbi:hypothetical protein EG68_00476 [Paragonimus skrjabini miyazakii]|uniref:Uncharacterized protein n=1 Tax=Paragonimus skrjabini miyazakii TaxID=59628 RepID=A0A8S9ZCD4_9TREM|nr:hypothetical protein EG68_00476 [Paragonimus skrjabini miyazakii]
MPHNCLPSLSDIKSIKLPVINEDIKSLLLQRRPPTIEAHIPTEADACLSVITCGLIV